MCQQLRHHLALKKIYPLTLGSIPGIPIGVFFLKKVDPELIQWVVGAMLITYSAYSFLTKRLGKGIWKGWAYPFGFFQAVWAVLLVHLVRR